MRYIPIRDQHLTILARYRDAWWARAERLFDVEDLILACKGVDVIVAFIGGSYLERNVLSLGNGGRLVQVGLLGGAGGANLPLEQLLYGHLQIIGTVMKSRTPEVKRQMVARFAQRWLPGLTESGLVPVVDSVYPLARQPMRTGAWSRTKAWAR